MLHVRAAAMFLLPGTLARTRLRYLVGIYAR